MIAGVQQSLKELNRALATSPTNEDEYRQYTNDLLLERNNLFHLDLTDLKVRFADLVSLVQARKTTNWIKGYDEIRKSKINLNNTLDDLERFKLRIEESLKIIRKNNYDENRDTTTINKMAQQLNRWKESNENMKKQLQLMVF